MRKYYRRFADTIEDRDPKVMWMDFGDGYVIPHEGRYLAVGSRSEVIRDADILLHTQLVNMGQSVEQGQRVSATTSAWSALRTEVLHDPSLMEFFPKWDRKFEEFIAGAYRESHWSDVILTPRSHDRGYDVAAYKRCRQILDEAKAYKPTLLVSHQVVRAALGLHVIHKAVSQVRVTTTSSFAPLIWDDFSEFIGNELELRDLPKLLRWLRSIGPQEDDNR